MPATGHVSGSRSPGSRISHDNPCIRRGVSEALEVAQRILETVRVIDAMAIDDTLPHPLKDALMRVVKHLLVLDPESDQRIHVEESSVSEIPVEIAMWFGTMSTTWPR